MQDVFAFIPAEIWQRSNMYTGIFIDKTPLRRATRFMYVIHLKGNGCKDEWVIALLKNRLAREDGCYMRRLRHVQELVKQFGSTRQNEKWFFHCVQDNDIKWIDGRTREDMCPSPLARMINTWDSYCDAIFKQTGVYPPLTAQRAWFNDKRVAPIASRADMRTLLWI